MLALSVWRERPDVKKIRATFGSVSPPSISDFEHGKGESFQPMFSYDFSLRERKESRPNIAIISRRYNDGANKLMVFLFPPETDTWIAVLRIGMGVQVVVYALFLRSDWHSLFSSNLAKGLVSRRLGEAITAFDSPLIPKLGWLVALGRMSTSEKKRYFPLPGPVCFAWDAVCCWDFSVARRRSLPGFFTSARLRAVDCLHTARTIS